MVEGLLGASSNCFHPVPRVCPMIVAQYLLTQAPRFDSAGDPSRWFSTKF